MAITDAYATPEEYRAVIVHSDNGDDAGIATDLQAISRFLDRKLARFFTVDAADVTRTFYPPRTSGPQAGWAESENPWKAGGYVRTLYIDDLSATPTSIKVDEDGDGLFTDETAWPATDFQMLPLNATLGPEPRPYTAIYVPDWSTKSGFSHMTQVIGKWGWPAIPAALKRGSIHLAGILRVESPRASRQIDEIGRVVSMSQIGSNILNELIASYSKRTGIS